MLFFKNEFGVLRWHRHSLYYKEKGDPMIGSVSPVQTDLMASPIYLGPECT